MNNQLTKQELIKYKKLLQKKYRQKEKLYIVEGKHLIEEAIKKNKLKLIITSDKKVKWTENISVKYCTYQNICSLSTTKNPQEYVGICSFNKFESETGNIILALNKISDPGNLGTLIRTAHSFGINDIIVEGVDIYNPKVLRSTQGAIFGVNIFNVDKIFDHLVNLKNKKYKLIGTLLDNDAIDYNKIKIKDKKIVIILGNEANGINENIKKILDYKIYIPIKFESLNVSVAGGILMEKYTKK